MAGLGLCVRPGLDNDRPRLPHEPRCLSLSSSVREPPVYSIHPAHNPAEGPWGLYIT